MLINRSTRRACSFLILALALASFAPSQATAEQLTADQLAHLREAESARIETIGRVFGSVVAVFGENPQQGGGSGVIFDADGLALTNHHVVAAGGTSGWAGLADGKLYRWKLVGTDPGGDLAIIQLEGKDKFPCSPLGYSDLVHAGDWVLAMGNPFTLAEDYRPTVTLGVVSGVGRYQEGSGQNMLVYGNCIQVDTSINPGNSGGPLYDLLGRVIGINGRISLKERGRVNVGVGYSISMRQIKTFLPEILATKTVRHGTLDAVFTDRQAGLTCSRINLDSVAADAGLKLGDKLLELDGIALADADHLTNLVSMLPSGWPATLKFEREGKQHTVSLRMLALDYGQAAQQQPRQGPGGGGLQLTKVDVIRDKKLNRRNAQRVLDHWVADARPAELPADLQGLVIRDKILKGDREVGEQEITLLSDGRYLVKHQLDGETETIGYDGKYHFRPAHDDKPRLTISPEEALSHPHVLQAAVLASMLEEKPAAHLGSLQLDGSDKAQGRRSYRLRWTDKAEKPVFLWMSVLNAQGDLDNLPLKAGTHLDSPRRSPAVLFDDWQTTAGISLPHRRAIALGLQEHVELEVITESVAELTTVPDVLQQPSDDAEKENDE